jgi:hypothetical protein
LSTIIARYEIKKITANDKKSLYRTQNNLPPGKLISQQTGKISHQLENWENRNGPDLKKIFLLRNNPRDMHE